MPITLDQAKALRRGDILHTNLDHPAKGQHCPRWKVNGQVQTWKRSPDRVSVPLKHGLYLYDHLTEAYLNNVHLEADCPL